MKKSLFLAMLLFSLLSIAVTAADLDMYPMPFVSGGSFTAQIIVGSAAPSSDVLAATEIAVSLQQKSNTRITAQMDDEFDKWKNGILIGLPCQNTAVASILGTKDCDIGLANSTGYLKLAKKDGQTFLIVTGKTPADTRKAARLLAKSSVHTLSGTEVVVTGTLDNPKAGEATQQLYPENQQLGCKLDSDCKSTEYCSFGSCTDLGCPEGTTAQGHDCITTAGETVEKQKTPEQPATEKAAEAKATSSQPESKSAEKPAGEPAEKKPSLFTRIISFFRNIFR